MPLKLLCQRLKSCCTKGAMRDERLKSCCTKGAMRDAADAIKASMPATEELLTKVERKSGVNGNTADQEIKSVICK